MWIINKDWQQIFMGLRDWNASDRGNDEKAENNNVSKAVMISLLSD